jgi:hypothetical protein
VLAALALRALVGVGERGGVGDRRARHGLDAVGVVAGQRPRHARTGVVADDVEGPDAELVGDTEDVEGELVHRERADVVDAGAGGVAPLGERDGAVPGRGECLHLEGPAD